MAKLKVALRGGFSDRNKIKALNTTIQYKQFDEHTRSALSNMTDIVIQNYFGEISISHRFPTNHQKEQAFIKNLLADVYGQVLDWAKSYRYDDLLEIMHDTFATDDYDSILTLVEYIAAQLPNYGKKGVVYKGMLYTVEQLYNHCFEQEYVGYRLIAGVAQTITDENEVNTIQETVNSKCAEVKQHIGKALSFLSDRQSPDYANSIKESISAVERMCSIILGKATTLGDALKHLEDSGVKIHPALKSAFSKLYGYTSDASGVRHAGELGGEDSTFEEAKFMLVSCCAFVNYLTGLMAKQK